MYLHAHCLKHLVNSLPRRKGKKWDEGGRGGGELMQQPPHGAKAAATRQNEERPQTTMTENGDKKPRSPSPCVHLYTVAHYDREAIKAEVHVQDRLRSSFHLFMAVPLSLQQTFSCLVHKKGTKVQYEFKGQSLRKGNYSMTNCRYGTQPCPLPLVPEGVMRGGKKNAFRDQILLPTITFPYLHFCSAASVVVATGLSFSYLFTSPNPPPLPSPFIPSIQQLAAP